MPGEGTVGRAARCGPVRWSLVGLSMLGSAVSVATVGCFCALIYPILKELRSHRLRREDGTEERMLGFWSILVLSVLAGCIFCISSWTFTYLDSPPPGGTIAAPLDRAHTGDQPASDFHMGYSVAVLNGVMAMLTDSLFGAPAEDQFAKPRHQEDPEMTAKPAESTTTTVSTDCNTRAMK
ncbi:hypothetical protein INR49_001379, partial [Caranx melampygus]